jgi:hypothetical protein
MNTGDPLRICDSSFQSQHAAKCDVLIAVDGRRIQFAIIDQLQDQLRLLSDRPVQHDPARELATLLEEEPLLGFHYRKIKVSMLSRAFVFIPSEAYSEQLLPVYSSFIQTTEQVRVTHLRGPRIKNIAALDPAIMSATTHKFGNVNFFSQVDPFIGAFTKSHFKPTKVQLFLLFRDDVVETAFSEAGRLRLYNVIDKRTPDEFNYFLLLLIRQLRLGSAHLQVVIAGIIEEGDDYYARLAKYFGEIVFTDSSKLVKMNETFAGVSQHRYFSLLGINLCE